jgi:hypothetical protein
LKLPRTDSPSPRQYISTDRARSVTGRAKPSGICAITDVTSQHGQENGRIADQSASGGIRRRTLEKELHLKRITLIASALCFALGAFSAVAEDKMDKMEKMEKTDKMDKMDKMGKSDKTHKKDKMAKHDKMDKMEHPDMEKPGAAQ